jgi:outer membrane murein-binding lipoprotein Lpp
MRSSLVCQEEAGLAQYEQQVVDRDARRDASIVGARLGNDRSRMAAEACAQSAERAARASLKTQIARLERELSGIVAERFPFISAPLPAIAGEALQGPCLLNLEQLERSRDRLAGRVQDMRRLVDQRAEDERASREQLDAMKLEPGRYKFVRLPVRDLGQGGCGVWEVRPRLGLIWMLAGWWQVKLSSGCPLPWGRAVRGPTFVTD